MKHFTLTLLLLAGMVLALTACSGGNRYQVDYGGQKDCYSNAKDSYRAGTTVTLYFELVATDTNYSFLLDGESIPFHYDDTKGFVIEFTMPEHDVTLECNSVNSMAAMPGDGFDDGFGGDFSDCSDAPDQDTPLLGIGNPLSAISLDDLAQETGCCLHLPEDVFQELQVHRINGSPVIYSLDFVYEDGNSYNFRMAEGTDHGDISGMYYGWTETTTSEDPSYTVSLTDAGQGICLWRDPYFTFSVSMDGNADLNALTNMRDRMIQSLENAE